MYLSCRLFSITPSPILLISIPIPFNSSRFSPFLDLIRYIDLIPLSIALPSISALYQFHLSSITPFLHYISLF